MAIPFYDDIGGCPICSNPIHGYTVDRETALYTFLPCQCTSWTWTVRDGKFIGGSAKELSVNNENS